MGVESLYVRYRQMFKLVHSVALQAEWLNEVQKLYAQMKPAMWVDEELLRDGSVIFYDDEDDEKDIEYAIRQQRAAKELEHTLMKAWSDLEAALAEAGYSTE